MTHTPIHHCSHNSQHVSLESPLGSASGFERCFLIEIPLPWSRVPLETPHMDEGVREAISKFQETQGKVSIYLLVPDAAYGVDGARLIDIQVVDGRIEKRELIASDGDIAAVIRSLAHDTPLPDTVSTDPTPWRDLIVCTHGSRDACCATFGFPMYLKMHEAAKSLPNTRVWRCSHLGGHRFAPTMIDLPSGRSWGLVDEPAARTILLRDAEASTVLDHYRGWVGHTNPEVQMLEADALNRFGWDWDNWRQSGQLLKRDTDGRGVEVELIGTHPSGESITLLGDIEWGEEFSTIASCNAEPVTYVRKKLVNLREAIPAGSTSP